MAGKEESEAAGAAGVAAEGEKTASSRPSGGTDDGSITPLAIGFVVIALLLAFLIAALTDLHMARRELQSVADSAALAASDSFEPAPGDEPGSYSHRPRRNVPPAAMWPPSPPHAACTI